MLPAVGHPAWMLLGGHFLPLVGCGFLLRSPCAHPLWGWDGKRLAGELKMLCRLLVGPCEWAVGSEAGLLQLQSVSPPSHLVDSVQMVLLATFALCPSPAEPS